MKSKWMTYIPHYGDKMNVWVEQSGKVSRTIEVQFDRTLTLRDGANDHRRHNLVDAHSAANTGNASDWMLQSTSQNESRITAG